MKTTIDLPDDLLYRAKVAAAQRKTTLKELVQAGLDWLLRSETAVSDRDEALAHLRKGLHLGGKPLTREQARWPISLWDALILAAARASGAAELITEDLNHGQDYGGVRVINPFR